VGRFYAALARAGVRVANGTWFGEAARVFRLGFGSMATSDLEAALEVMTHALEQTVERAAAPAK
jgi:aspartate/methionine/tyrosine aminotransferase